MSNSSRAKKKVGIIGCGTIGGALAQFLLRYYSDHVKLAYLCDHHDENIKAIQRKLSLKAKVVSFQDLIKKSDIIIEAASPKVVHSILSTEPRANQELLIMSIGGFTGLSMESIRKKYKARFWLPSGALGGLDAVLSARESGIQSVKLITKKPPAGLMGAPYFDKKKFPVLKTAEEKCIFRGSAKQAIKAFPKNVNVAAILSLAGIGFLKTRVEVWTSKKYRRNQHEIQVQSKVGNIFVRVENKPSQLNPKTSALAVESGKATLRKMFSSLHLGT